MKTYSGGAILLITYFAMLAVCGVLNFVGKKSLDFGSIAINVMMFVIIGFIILWSNARCLGPVGKMTTRMNYTIQTIKYEYSKTGGYLWNSYKDKKDLFDNKILDSRYQEFCIEKKRLAMMGTETCDIEEFINDLFVDTKVKKGLLGSFPGVMTGLGILGTFVGLSIGLQHFNTGSAEEITNSIAPLMDGIKVAFHTSIYGMVFSLIFNFVYKKTVEDAYTAVDKFNDVFHKYVLPVKKDTSARNRSMENSQAAGGEMKLSRQQMDEFSSMIAYKIVQALTVEDE